MEKINPILLLDILVKFTELSCCTQVIKERLGSAARAVNSLSTFNKILTHTSDLDPAVRVASSRCCVVELSYTSIMKILNLRKKISVEIISRDE